MTSSQFTIARRDGRSHQQVVIDVVSGAEPGTIYTYDALSEALAAGTDRTFSVRAIQGIVRSAKPRMLREQQRTLRTLAGVGYKVAHANEHNALAHTHERKAKNQIKTGLMLLEQVRWDEMDENTRRAHEANLLIAGGMYHQMQAFDRRMRAVENAVRRLVD